MFTQISAKQGIKQFKEKAVTDIVNDYKELHGMNIFGSVCLEDPTLKQKWDLLCEITMIKEKRSVNIKGRACADGIAQIVFITKKKAAARMVLM